MSVLLFVIGCVLAVAGIGMVGYGIPVNEFSFGNTLIVAGTTAIVGGFIVIALGAAVRQLQRIAEMLAMPVAARRPLGVPEPAGATSAASRIPFPPRPRPTSIGEQAASATAPSAAEAPANPADESTAEAAMPMLQNPDVPVGRPVSKGFEDVLLPPQQTLAAPAEAEQVEPAPPPPPPPPVTPIENEPETEFDKPWRSPPSPPPARDWAPAPFDTMWPAESRPARHSITEETEPQPLPEYSAIPEPEAPLPQPVEEPPVAILKSGVVDGMGYTLYVDGSIEAELPQGTLRFASINELREHLAKNS